MHTAFSGDCEIPLDEMVRGAIAKGQPAVMVTDHMDYDFPNPAVGFILDTPAYGREIEKLQRLHPDIEIRKGIEIGYQPHLKERLNRLVDAEDFDLVINSLHICDGQDYMNGDFFRGKTPEQSYRRYFEGVLECVETFEGYDVLGHLDFIVRYAPVGNRQLHYRDYQSLIDSILMQLVKKEKGLEVNTSGIRYGLGVFHPQEEIIHHYYALGGRIVTIGSDAHRAEDIQADFVQAFHMLKTAGFTEVTDYRGRRPMMTPITVY